jgi:hypothetical protein
MSGALDQMTPQAAANLFAEMFFETKRDLRRMTAAWHSARAGRAGLRDCIEEALTTARQALACRDDALVKLSRIADEHGLRGNGDGHCICGTNHCETLRLLKGDTND